MKNVLVVAPCFAPSSFPPALRNRLFLLHLEKFGWKPVVLTVEPKYMEDPPDTVFQEMIPKDLEVIRTGAFSHRWTRKIGIGNIGFRSFWHLKKEADKLCRQRKIDLLFISGPPWISFLIGVWIKKKYKIPYVLDYIDPWVSFTKDWRGRAFDKRWWAERMALVLDPLAVKHSAAVVSVSEGINAFMGTLYPKEAWKLAPPIPYGIEPADFDFVRGHSGKNKYFNPGDGFRHVVYVGVVWGNAYGTLRALFSALKKIKNRDPKLFASLRWHFIGTSYAPNGKPQIMPMAREFGVDEVVTEISERVPYPSALGALLDADVILTFGSNDPTYTSSKIFPCILAGKPILAVYHEQSSVVEIMRKTKAGEIVTFSDAHPVEESVDAIEKSMGRVILSEKAKVQMDWASFEEYSAFNMTRRLAGIFNQSIQKSMSHDPQR